MTKTSIGVQELRKRIGEKAKAEPRHRFWGLYTHVWKLDVLREAYRLARKNNGAPGVDGVSFSQIEEEGAEVLLSILSRELREKTYRPLPCRQVNIPKEGGKVRGLKIPAIRDRVVQGAVHLILEPIFEADFQPGSYGYRPGRTAHQALDRVKEGLWKRLHHVIDLDLASYFDTVRHDLLLSKIAKRVQDDDMMWMCKRILRSGGKRGLPQGSVDLGFVRRQVDAKVRQFASRQRPKRRGGCRWTTWSNQEIYQKWGLFSDYKVFWCRGVQ
jgi:RNA-directed DNA polymerase